MGKQTACIDKKHDMVLTSQYIFNIKLYVLLMSEAFSEHLMRHLHTVESHLTSLLFFKNS